MNVQITTLDLAVWALVVIVIWFLIFDSRS